MTGQNKPVQSRAMSPIHPRAIDVGAKMHVAAVGPDRASEPVRTFGTFTDDLHRLWFQECGIKTVAMESVYWIPVFEILEQRGFEVLLVNARDAKHVPGRKTDMPNGCSACTSAARQFPSQGRDRGVARVSAPARAACGTGGVAYPAHAESPDADDCPGASRGVGHHGGHRPAHPARHRRRRA